MLVVSVEANMKVLIVLCVVSLSLANEVLDVRNLNFENLKVGLDKKLADAFLHKYEAREDGSGITAVINEFADIVFKNIEDLARKEHLDPLALVDVEEDFLASSIALTNGSLNGIATIARSDDVVVSYFSQDKIMEAYFPIVFSNLNFTYDYHVIVLLIGPKGSMTGKIEEFKMNIRLQFDFNTYHVTVAELTTANKGHVSLTFHGNGIVDIVVNLLTEFVTAVLQPLVALVIEGLVSDVVTLVVDAVNVVIDIIFPPGTISTTVGSLI